MVRLLLALFVFALALPAAARPACHTPALPSVGMQHGGHHAPQPAPVMAEHVCIGCIPLTDSGAPIVASAMMRALPVAVAVTRLDLGGGVLPALPPPRHG